MGLAVRKKKKNLRQKRLSLKGSKKRENKTQNDVGKRVCVEVEGKKKPKNEKQGS